MTVEHPMPSSLDTPFRHRDSRLVSAIAAHARDWITEQLTSIREPGSASAVRGAAHAESLASILLQRRNLITPAPPESLAAAKMQIARAVEEQRPIRIKIPMGCYKPEGLPSGRTANWAEFFHFSFMSRLATSMAELHEPGLELVYDLGDLDMDLLADVAPGDIDRYASSFRQLVGVFQRWVPAGVRFEVTRLSERITLEEYRRTTAAEMERLRPWWTANPDHPLVVESRQRAARNKAELLKEEDLQELALRSFAMVNVDLAYLGADDGVSLLYRRMRAARTDRTMIPFRSCRGTQVQFWVGEGALVWTGRKIRAAIFGKRSVASAVLLTSVRSHGLEECGAHFSQIGIYSEG